jgi:nitrite reductase/ring-hydroxylating ferredoxin subunit
VNPLVSVLVTSGEYASLRNFPFQQLGLAALAILTLMAATSHDFWLRALTAPVWKSMHMLVYLAYALVIAHVALGALQAERHVVFTAVTWSGLVLVLGLHLASARHEWGRDGHRRAVDGYVDVCAVEDIPEGRARTVCVAGERVAVFRHEAGLSAVSNACRHQNGPLGEGKIVSGCIVCPWHGYEYDPASGRAPAPFTETLPTFAIRVRDGRVMLHPAPNAPGTFVPPASIR